MKKVTNNTGNDMTILKNWQCEKSGFWKLETVHEGTVPVNNMKLIKFLESRGILEMPIEEVEKLFINEFVKIEKPKMEYGTPEGYLDADGDLIKIDRKEKAILEAKGIAQVQERIKKQKLENIMFDNESEGVPAGNGLWE